MLSRGDCRPSTRRWSASGFRRFGSLSGNLRVKRSPYCLTTGYLKCGRYLCLLIYESTFQILLALREWKIFRFFTVSRGCWNI